MPETTKQNEHSIQRNSQNSKPTSTRPKGKSRFAQKSRGKSKAPVVVKRGPINTYTSVCCSLPATKPGCVKVDKKKALEQGLGSWHCSGCRKSCKVNRSKNAPQNQDSTPGVPSEVYVSLA
jgi:hypothetical protein